MEWRCGSSRRLPALQACKCQAHKRNKQKQIPVPPNNDNNNNKIRLETKGWSEKGREAITMG
jgi:hypothetical protein